MANKSIVSNTKLDAIATAIKAKDSSATTPMTLDQMATAIANIGGGGGEDLDKVLDGSIKEITNSSVTRVKKYCFYQGGLTRVSMPAVTRIDDNAFFMNSNLAEISFPACTYINNNAFSWCSKLTEISFPNLVDCYREVFSNMSKLVKADLGNCKKLYEGAFSGCSALTTLILRRSTMCELEWGKQMFPNTPIASGTGLIYVPDELVETYRADTGWSTYASQIKGLSELPTA